MSTPTFAETHNLIAFLEKPTESDEFEQIVDFLNANTIKYALTDVRLQALVDGKKVIVNEASIRCDLRFDDAEGIACLPNAAIFEELARIGNRFFWGNNTLFKTMMVQDPEEVGEIPTDTQDTPILTQPSSFQPQRNHKSKRKQRKETNVSQDETPTAEHIPTPSHDPLPSGLSDQDDASKQGRIAELDANEDLSLINETAQDQGRRHDQDMFRFNDLDGDEVVVDVSAGEKEEQSEKVVEKEVSTADPVTTAGEVVTTTDVKVSADHTTTTTTDDESTLAQTLIEIKVVKLKALTTAAITVTVVSTRPKEKGIIMQEPSKTPYPKLIVSSQQLSQPKDKGKAKIVKPERPLKRKEQIMMHEQVARDLEAQMQADLEVEQRIAKKKEEEAHIAMVTE
uniref:Uncharacterized protein n=1 Tax=Tanacetum cinerariifolium TaxID=118510 RepID=A0A6L2NKA7_TANCI|nr:hypothetical protein [Tanacetum cinerariifolium]